MCIEIFHSCVTSEIEVFFFFIMSGARVAGSKDF